MGNEPPPCSQCHGMKRIQVTEDDDENETVREYFITCPLCGGTGKGS